MSAVNLFSFFWVFPVVISPPLPIGLPAPTENWQYIHTECSDGWWPHNGVCYRLLSETEAGSWEESSRACGSQGANLTSLTSLSEVEMLLQLLKNCKQRHARRTNEVLSDGDTKYYFVCACPRVS